MIAALNPRHHVAFLGRIPIRIGDDTDVDVLDPTDISDPIILTQPIPEPITTSVPVGPSVPTDFTPLTPQQLAEQGYDSNSVAIGPPPPGYVYLPDGSLQPIAGVSQTPITTTDEPVSAGGLQFPPGTVGIDDAGNPVNGSGQVLTPTGAVNSGVSPVGVITPIAQAATKIAALATGTSSLPTVYPAPAGAVLPAGAVGVNAQGYPINASGQILSATPLTASSGLSWFTNSTLVSGLPNWGVLAGAVAGLAVVSSLMGKKKR